MDELGSGCRRVQSDQLPSAITFYQRDHPNVVRPTVGSNNNIKHRCPLLGFAISPSDQNVAYAGCSQAILGNLPRLLAANRGTTTLKTKIGVHEVAYAMLSINTVL